MTTPTWIAADWGPSELRLWAMSRDGLPIGQVNIGPGMKGLTLDQFEPAILDLAAPFMTDDQPMPVLICGMAGARQGWQETPYVMVPCKSPLLKHATRPETQDPRLDVYVLAGVAQDDPADAMRGEETQIAGFLSQRPDFDGVLCLPGSHSKWVRISAGEIVSFRSFMTGELFDLLSNQSMLRHSVGSDGWNDTAFAEAITDAMTSPQYFTSRLFSLRADDVLHGSSGTARARLSGLLLGLELAGARPFWLGQQVEILGKQGLIIRYAAALATVGVIAKSQDVAPFTCAGLFAAYQALKEG